MTYDHEITLTFDEDGKFVMLSQKMDLTDVPVKALERWWKFYDWLTKQLDDLT